MSSGLLLTGNTQVRSFINITALNNPTIQTSGEDEAQVDETFTVIRG